MDKYPRIRSLELIELIRKRECLWNCKKLEYFNKGKVEHAWKEIARILNDAVPKIQLRWKTIRSMYGNNLYTSKRKNKNKPYYLASYLEFLRPFIKACCKSKYCNGVRRGAGYQIKENSINEGIESIVIETSDENGSADVTNRTKRSEAAVSGKHHQVEKYKDHNMPNKSSCDMFLESLLPFIDDMTKNQIIRFRLKVLNLIDNILD